MAINVKNGTDNTWKGVVIEMRMKILILSLGETGNIKLFYKYGRKIL